MCLLCARCTTTGSTADDGSSESERGDAGVDRLSLCAFGELSLSLLASPVAEASLLKNTDAKRKGGRAISKEK